MKYNVILSPDAKEDIRAATWWYSNIDPQLGFRFETEVDHIFYRISQTPYQFPITHQSTRKALLKRFHYAVYFNFNSKDNLVIAVVHQRQLTPWDE
jgi:plasmid stabilization system protein ParE